MVVCLFVCLPFEAPGYSFHANEINFEAIMHSMSGTRYLSRKKKSRPKERVKSIKRQVSMRRREQGSEREKRRGKGKGIENISGWGRC